MSDLNLTPHRELPPEIRERLRARVLDGLNGAEHHATVHPLRRRPAGAWLAAAAAVVAVAAVGVVVVQGVDRQSTPVSSTTAMLDRCWNVLKHESVTSDYPDRDSWRLVLQTETQGATMLAIRGKRQRMFCGLTPTTVSVSPPFSGGDVDVDPGGVETAMEIYGGPIAGFADVAGSKLSLQVNPPPGYVGDYELRNPGKVADGMFVHPGPGGEDTKVRFKGTTVAHHDFWPSMFMLVDHPELRGERTSPKGKLLGRCLDDNWFQVADGESLQVGASVKAGSATAMVMRNSPRTFGLCAVDPADKRDVAGFYLDRDIDLPNTDAPVQLLYYEDSGIPSWDVLPEGLEGVDVLAAGTASSEVRYVRIGGPDGSSTLTDVVDGTFVLTGSSPFAEFGPEADSAASRLEATAYDARGDEIWSGEVNPFKDDG